MILKELASEFQLMLISNKIEMASAGKVRLGQIGYDTILVDSDSELRTNLESINPHVIILDYNSISKSLSEIVKEIHGYSSEIAVVVVTDQINYKMFFNYSHYNVKSFIAFNTDDFLERLVWEVNNAVECIFLNFKNEQLFEETQSLKKLIEDFKATNHQQEERLVQNSARETIAEFIESLRNADSKEAIIDVLMQSLKSEKVYYFKYASSLNSFLMLKTSFSDHRINEGVGCPLNPEESKELVNNLELNIVPPTVNQLVINLFSLNRPFSVSLYDGENLDGIFIYDYNQSAEQIRTINDYIKIADVYYSFFCLSKRISLLEVVEPVSHLFNKRHYINKLKEEHERSKRLRLPLSLIKISIDDFEELERSLGVITRDSIVKSISNVMMTTGRANDIHCRTDINEFSIILPHCNRKGASLRAERLRRLIESHSLSENGLKVTVSLGASEYPSLVSDTTQLDESALKSMQFISSKGGNRICLFKPSVDFVPEFEVDENAT